MLTNNIYIWRWAWRRRRHSFGKVIPIPTLVLVNETKAQLLTKLNRSYKRN